MLVDIKKIKDYDDFNKIQKKKSTFFLNIFSCSYYLYVLYLFCVYKSVFRFEFIYLKKKSMCYYKCLAECS